MTQDFMKKSLAFMSQGGRFYKRENQETDYQTQKEFCRLRDGHDLCLKNSTAVCRKVQYLKPSKEKVLKFKLETHESLKRKNSEKRKLYADSEAEKKFVRVSGNKTIKNKSNCNRN